MKKLVTILFVAALSLSFAQTIVRVMGTGGTDTAVVGRLLDEVIGAGLAEQGITLQYEPLDNYDQAITNALSAGTAADLFYVPSATAPGLIATGRILPIGDRVDSEPFLTSLLDVYTFNGMLYGIPKDFNTLALHFNEDLFDEAGVEYPNDDDTWETLAEKLRAVDALGSDVYGACFPAAFDRFGAFAYANGWQPFDEDDNVNLLDEAFVEAFTWYTGLVQEGVAVQPSDIGQGWGGACLASDNVGVVLEGGWIFNAMRDLAPNLQYGSARMPYAPNGERGNIIYTVAWGVNATSPNIDAALVVLEALTSVEAQQFVLEEGLAVPSRSALLDNPYFEQDDREAQGNLTVFEGASDDNVFGFQFGAIGTDFMGPINNALSAVMTGQQSVEAALTAAQAELSALVARSQQR